MMSSWASTREPEPKVAGDDLGALDGEQGALSMANTALGTNTEHRTSGLAAGAQGAWQEILSGFPLQISGAYTTCIMLHLCVLIITDATICLPLHVLCVFKPLFLKCQDKKKIEQNAPDLIGHIISKMCCFFKSIKINESVKLGHVSSSDKAEEFSVLKQTNIDSLAETLAYPSCFSENIVTPSLFLGIDDYDKCIEFHVGDIIYVSWEKRK